MGNRLSGSAVSCVVFEVDSSAAVWSRQYINGVDIGGVRTIPPSSSVGCKGAGMSVYWNARLLVMESRVASVAVANSIEELVAVLDLCAVVLFAMIVCLSSVGGAFLGIVAGFSSLSDGWFCPLITLNLTLSLY